MIVLKILLASGLLWWLIGAQQLPVATLADTGFTPAHGGVALLLLGNFWGQIRRWLLLLRLQEIPLSFVTGVRLFCIGQFFFITSLGMLGGDVARGYYVVKHSADAKLAAASTVLADRMLGLFTYLLLGGAAFFFLRLRGEPATGLLWFGQVIPLLLGGMLVFLLVIGSERGQRALFGYLPVCWQEVLRRIVTAYRPAPGAMARLVGVSLLTNLFHLLAFMAASRALGIPLGWGELLLTLPLVVLANMLPLPMGGLGAGETAAQLLLTQAGIPNGALIMLLLRITQWSLVLPFGFYFYVREQGLRPGETPRGSVAP